MLHDSNRSRDLLVQMIRGRYLRDGPAESFEGGERSAGGLQGSRDTGPSASPSLLLQIQITGEHSFRRRHVEETELIIGPGRMECDYWEDSEDGGD